MLLCLYSYLPYGQLLVHCILPCCTCSLLVHHICTRLERISDDDVDVTIDLLKTGHDTISWSDRLKYLGVHFKPGRNSNT